MHNVSLVDDMPNITGNFSDEVYYHQDTDYERIFLELFTVVGLLSVVANSLLIFVILKYKKLREDATNIIFLHVNILEAIYLVVAPLTVRAAKDLFYIDEIFATVFCVSYQLEIVIMFAVTWFLFLLICDWYLKLYHKETYVKFCRTYKFFIIMVYVVVALACPLLLRLCFRFYMAIITHLVLFGCEVLIAIFAIVMNIMHLIRKRRLTTNHRKGNIGLAMANIFYLMWSPTFILVLFSMVFYINAPILLIILCCLGFSSPIFNLIYLYNYDDNYNVFLKQVFRCTCHQYKNESLEDQSVSYNDANGVQIPHNVI